MSNIVFILGAGASKQCGAPLMGEFLDVANDLLRANSVGDKNADYERVFSAIGALQSVHSKAQLDLNNIESIFTVLELGKIIQRVPGFGAEEISGAIGSLKEVIVKTLELTMKFPIQEGYIDVPQPYDKFGELLKHLRDEAVPKQSISVITFNYDIGADMAMFRSGLGPDYILARPNNDPHLVPLLKLHGSLNWAVALETHEIVPLHLNQYFQHYHVRGFGGRERSETRVPIGSQLVEYFHKHQSVEVEKEPVIVPPSWNKADYHSALSDVWMSAASHLSAAEQIFIIGYSLPETDAFFRHLYALGSVGTAPLRRIAVFNPDDSGATESRFRSLLGPGALARYEYHTVGFGSAITTIQSLFPVK